MVDKHIANWWRAYKAEYGYAEAPEFVQRESLAPGNIGHSMGETGVYTICMHRKSHNRDEARGGQKIVESIAKRKVVVGDIHGELVGLKEVLGHAGLIDAGDQWIGGDTLLVQAGDVIDRGPASVESVSLLRELQKQALKQNGEVIRICGNHELKLLEDGAGYADFSDAWQLARELKEEVSSGLLRASYTDGSRLYTHAGLRSAIRQRLINEIKKERPGIGDGEIDLFVLSDYINEVFKKCVREENLKSHPIFNVDKVRGGTDAVGGIFWGDYSLISESERAWDLPQIFGHTPARRNEVRHAHDLKLINIDAGMCRVYGGFRVYLEITPEGKIVQHSKDERNGKWSAKIIGKEPAPLPPPADMASGG